MPRITPSGTDLRPVPDGSVVPEMPRKRFASGRFTGRSLMIGIVDAEMTKHMGLLFLHDLSNTDIGNHRILNWLEQYNTAALTA